MPLPIPIETTLPSIADGTTLACRVYLSPPFQPNVEWLGTKAAVVAHPYAPLGGNFNDPVVLLVVEELCDAGFVVVTFNFRGANDTRSAATSWTSKPEIADFTTVVSFLIHFMLTLNAREIERLRVVLGGYSYGSMVASSINSISRMLEDGARSQYTTTKLVAEELVANLSPTKPSAQKPTAQMQLPLLETHYLLVSPLLPPVSSLLTLFSSSNRDECLQTHKTLAIFGSNDQFTSSSKLRRWTERIGIQGEEIEGADHFWHDMNAVLMLRQTIRSWVA